MIIFITKRKHNVEGVQVINTMDTLFNWLNTVDEVGFDFESNGLDAYKNIPLLLAIGNKEIQFVIDCTSIDMTWLNDKLADKLIIGHNIKFDIKMSKVHYNFFPKNLYCTMIADQRIYQGVDFGDFGWNLPNTILRHCKTVPPEMDKSIREYFIGKTRNVIFNTEHIIYAATDIQYLPEVRQKQMALIKELELDWWVKTYEFPLIRAVAKCELTGFALDTNQIRNNVIDAEKELHETAVKLDEIAHQLRDKYGINSEVIQGGKYDKKRAPKPIIQHIGLFGEMSETEYKKTVKASKTKNSRAAVNWNSADEVMKLCAVIGQALPLQGYAEKQFGYLVPIVDLKTGRVNKSIGVTKDGKIVNVPMYNLQKQGWTTDKDAIQKCLVDNPKTIGEKFLTTLVKYRKIAHELSTFGLPLIEKINSITNRIHTIFRQCHAVNGRFQSGGGNKERDKPNFQNIPREAKFRTAFRGGTYTINGITKNYSVVTCDLTGAEVTIMCDKANDEKLYEWAVVNDDSHSPMVQNIWRHIFLYRAGLEGRLWDRAHIFDFETNTQAKIDNVVAKLECQSSTNSIIYKWFTLYKEFTVTKKINKPYRQAGKNGTFGGIYGMKPKKAQETYNNTNAELAKENENYEPVNVTLEEGKVILIAQKRAIPKTFKMVEDNVQIALRQGYLVLNERSKTRIWFYDIAKLVQKLSRIYGKNVQIYYDNKTKRYICANDGSEHEIDSKIIQDADGQSRNVPISGTQADIVKEAIVKIDQYIENNNLDCHLLSQVHDELVYSCPKEIDGHSDEFNNINLESGGIQFNFSKFVQETMTNTANLYLKNVKMKASVEVADTWIK